MRTSVVGWIARISGIVVIAVVLWGFAELMPLPRHLPARGIVQLTPFFGVAAGLALGWWRELAGGIVSVACLGAFFLANQLLSTGNPTVLSALYAIPFAVPGVLFIAAALTRSRTQRPPDAAKPLS